MNKLEYNSSSLSTLGFNTYGKDVGFLNVSQKILAFSSSKVLSFLSLLLLNILVIMPQGSAQTICNSPDKLIFSGSYDCVTVGNTMSLAEDASNCGQLPNSSKILTIPTGATVKAAYLFWSGSGALDNNVTLNGNSVTAESTKTYYEPAWQMNFFGARANVTNLVQNSGVYTVANLTWSSTGSYCTAHSAYGAWALVVVYESSNLPQATIHINSEQFRMTYPANTYSTTIDCIDIPSNCASNAKLTIVAFEGDNYKGENFYIGGTLSSDPNNFRGQSGPNLDILTFDVANKINSNTPSLSYGIQSYLSTTIWGQAIEGLFDYVKILKYNTCASTPICDNITNGGTISKNCNNGIVSLTASTPVTGGTGTIEYIWLKSTQGCPGDPAQAIAGATGESYTIPAGSVTQTTYFARCARRVGCTVWSGSSNCISVSPNECTTTPNTCNFAPCFKSTISVLASPNWTGYASWNLSNMPSSGWTTTPFQYSADGGATWTTLSFSFSPSSTGVGMITYADHFLYRVTIRNSAGTCSQTYTWTFTNPPCGTCGDGSPRRVPGTACNDNNPNTTNDIVQPDGCSCAGTPVNGNICDFSPCLAVSDIYTQWATPDKNATWTLAQMPSSGWTNTVFQYSKDGGATWLNLSQKFSPAQLSIASLPYGNIYQEDPYLYRATFQNTAGTCTKTINWSASTPVYCTPCADGSPKKVPGTACNDDNPNTINDVIQADGCSCAGTPTSTVTCNYTP